MSGTGTFTAPERRALVAALSAAALVPLNSTMIAVALPDVAADLGTSQGLTALLVTAYLVAMALGQPFAGRVGDRLGSARVARGALVGFAAASVAAALAPGFAALVAARVGQAAFGAALVPNLQAILRVVVAGGRRGRAFGLFGAGIGAGAAAGPLIGGALVQLAGWRAIFWANAPVVAAALALAAGLGAAGRRTGAPAPEEHPPGQPPQGQDAAAGSLRQAPFVAACVTHATGNLAQYSVLLVVPLVLAARGWGSASTGLVLAALTVGMVLGPVGGWVGDRVGRTRPVVVGTATTAVGALTLAAVAPGPPAGLVVGVALVGAGTGFAGASLQTAALEAVPAPIAGAAAGVLSTSRYLGSIVGSVAIALLVSDGTTGVRAVLLLTVASAVVAVAAGSRVERRPAGTRRGDPAAAASLRDGT